MDTNDLKTVVARVSDKIRDDKNSKNSAHDKLVEKFKDPNYAELFVEETFTNLDVVQAEDEIRKLKKATDYAEKEMRDQMVTHYRKYIFMTEQVKGMTPSMGRLRSRLQDMRAVCSQLRDRALSDHRELEAMGEDAFVTLPEIMNDTSENIAEEHSERMEKLEDKLDDLDEQMSMRSFKDAVMHLKLTGNWIKGIGEKDKRMLFTSEEKILARSLLDKRLSLLTKGLCAQLANPALRRQECKQTIDHLRELNQQERAKQIFLENRSEYLKAKQRQLHMERDVKATVEALSTLYFGTIRGTHADFGQYFPAPILLSSFALWAKVEVETFWEHCRKHTLTVINCARMVECVECARQKCDEFLTGGGIGLTFELDRLILQDLAVEIQQRCEQSKSEVRKHISQEVGAEDHLQELSQELMEEYYKVEEEEYGPRSYSTRNRDGLTYPMTLACSKLVQEIHQKMAELQPLASTRLIGVYPAIMNGFYETIEEFHIYLYEGYQKIMYSGDIQDDAFKGVNSGQPNALRAALACIKNMLCITERFIPMLALHLKESFHGAPASQLNAQASQFQLELENSWYVMFAIHRTALHLGFPLGEEEEHFYRYSLRHVTQRREWSRSHPGSSDKSNPFPAGLGHTPVEYGGLVNDDGHPANNGAGQLAKEPGYQEGAAVQDGIPVRWPGGHLDLSQDAFDPDNMGVSPGFITLIGDIREDFVELDKHLGAGAGMQVGGLILKFVIDELRQTVIDEHANGLLKIGRGGFQQLMVDMTYFAQSAGEVASSKVISDVEALKYFVQLKAEADPDVGEQVSSDLQGDHDEWLEGVAKAAIDDEDDGETLDQVFGEEE